uniref:Serine/threonine-protein phosphatase 7 long form homolog n=1 Tax=Nicotiana sylvestris TaxID=4096 RepID=A0A1U7Y3Q5_NICSY
MAIIISPFFIWTSYSEELIGTLPAYCTHGRHIWRASVPLTCLDIVEHHASERVFRQFGFPQSIPTQPAWDPLHYERDDRMRVDDTFIEWLTAQLGIWDSRGDLTPAPQHFPIEVYMAWYRTVSRLFIGNPVHQVDGRYVSYAGRHEALDYSRRLMDVAAQTLQRGRSDQRLAHQPDYADPATYQRGRGMPRGGGRRAAAAPRRPADVGRCGRGRRGGPQQGGFE